MRVTRVIAQIDLAAASDHTPGLLLWEGQANVPSKAVLTLLLERATTEVNKPGGRTRRDAAPAISPIDAAITNAEQVSRRTGGTARSRPRRINPSSSTSSVPAPRPAERPGGSPR